MPRAVDLAVELSLLEAGFVVVGSTARWLVSGAGAPEPRDLDVVVEARELDPFVDALRLLGGTTTAARLRRCRDVRIRTAWGPLDVFLGPAPASRDARVRDVVVLVAA
ncbi:MAG TPA: hypothetical protein VFL59_06115 [Candidatus Nanopelagicales bacterium]|nr:hypothetical protein [Candidatus Nanopelagicales bacterium]